VTQTEEVLRLVHEVFGADIVGGYPHGSAVLGGLRPHSDIDLFVVVRRRTTRQERRVLTDRLLAISGSGGPEAAARPVELTIAVQDDVRPWRYPPRCEFQYGEWLRAAYERGETPEPAPSPDLALLVTMVLLGDRALVGPPPRQVLGPVPAGDLTRSMLAGIPELLAEVETDTRNVLLTLARIWTTLATGEIMRKDAAAEWVLGRLPAEHRTVLARARAGYLGIEPERWDDLRPRVGPCAAYLVAAIERARPTSGT